LNRGNNPGKSARIVSFLSKAQHFNEGPALSVSEQVPSSFIKNLFAPHQSNNPLPFLLTMPKCTTLHSPHPSSSDKAALPTITTNPNCTHSFVPPFQSPTTYDPSPLSADNEEVVLSGVVSPAEARTLAVNTSTHAGGKDTKVRIVVAFFNHQPPQESSQGATCYVNASTSLQMCPEG
jgi:hypothetical protein